MNALRVGVSTTVPGLSIDVSTASESGRLALFGPSGAGKTTILKALAGFDAAAAVTLKLGDETLCGSGTTPKSHERDMAFVFQDDRLFPHMSVSDNIAYGANGDLEAIREAIEVADCEALLERSTTALSGGERRRVSIARSLARKPKLLLLDEPYNGLDRPSATALRQRLAAHLSKSQTAFVLVTHVLDDVLAHDCAIALLRQGKVISTGPAETVFATDEGRALLADADDAAQPDVVSLYRVGNSSEVKDTGLTSCEIAPDLALRIPAPLSQAPRYLKVRASDVSITLAEPSDTSVLNVIPAQVVSIEQAQPYAMIDLAITPSLVLKARITSYSCERLGLAPGKQVFAQIKSVALAN